MTKAANIKRKRANRVGRPKDEDCERTVSGRKSRAKPPSEDMRMVALTARERHTGLPKELAGHEKAGTVLGRLWLTGVITEPMREAGERYLELYNGYLRAIKAPVPLAKSNSAGDGGDVVTDDYVDWAIRAVASYEVMKAALNERVANLSVLVEYLVVCDVELDEHSQQYTRIGLLLLARKMGLEQ